MLMNNVIVIVVTVVFFVFLFLFVARAGSQVTIAEQIYAKQIALLIDNAKVGTIIDLDVSELKKIGEDNKILLENAIMINNKDGNVRIALSSKGGYEFEFFNANDVSWSIDKNNLHMEVISHV